MKINKIIKSIALMFFTLVAMSSFGQNITDVKETSTQNVKVLQDAIIKELPNTTFTSNQTVKLERIYMDINTQKKQLADSNISKLEYSQKAAKIEAQYADLIAGVLTTEQKRVYEKLKKKTSFN